MKQKSDNVPLIGMTKRERIITNYAVADAQLEDSLEVIEPKAAKV